MTLTELIKELEKIRDKHKAETVGQASRISGVSPADNYALEDLIVLTCDYNDDTDEAFTFNKIDGVELVETARKSFISIYRK